jgi:hypothetical protein
MGCGVCTSNRCIQWDDLEPNGELRYLRLAGPEQSHVGAGDEQCRWRAEPEAVSVPVLVRLGCLEGGWESF